MGGGHPPIPTPSARLFLIRSVVPARRQVPRHLRRSEVEVGLLRRGDPPTSSLRREGTTSSMVED